MATGSVQARVTPLDPARAPQTMPGEYRATGGVRIESFGAIKVDLQDAQGQRLNLKAGAKAVIRIPLSTRSADTPPTIPLFYFDEQQALWVKEGSATLKKVNGEWVYEGEVSHFTQATSGHVYFTLKDESGQLKCAMFRQQARLLAQPLREGAKVVVASRTPATVDEVVAEITAAFAG